jgi:hypothetical protein
LDLSKLLEVAAEGDCAYPFVEDTLCDMGEGLGRLHWPASYDGHDVEFAMGMASFSGVTMYVIAFNQVCR